MDFKPSEFKLSKMKDHNALLKYSKKSQMLKLGISFDDINKVKLVLSADGKYYLLHIKPRFEVPDIPNFTFEIDFKLAIKREKIDSGKYSVEEIVRRAFIEGDLFRSNYNPNSDGRIPNTYYGGRFK